MINTAGLILGNYGGAPIGYVGVTTDGSDWRQYDSDLNQTFASAINDVGQAAGAEGSRARIWQPGGTHTNLLKHSSAGTIGQAGAVYGVVAVRGQAPYTYRWKDGVVTHLPGLAGYYETFPGAINRPGVLVGWAYKSKGKLATVAVIENGGTWKEIPGLGGTETRALGINDAGVVVGYGSLPGDEVYRGFVYQGGKTTDVGSFGGDLTQVTSVNNQGVSVGGSKDSEGIRHPFAYFGGTMYNLEQWMDSTGDLTNLGAVSINDFGQIVGLAEDASGSVHGWLATPLK